jgi:hypothetical protein
MHIQHKTTRLWPTKIANTMWEISQTKLSACAANIPKMINKDLTEGILLKVLGLQYLLQSWILISISLWQQYLIMSWVWAMLRKLKSSNLFLRRALHSRYNNRILVASYAIRKTFTPTETRRQIPSIAIRVCAKFEACCQEDSCTANGFIRSSPWPSGAEKGVAKGKGSSDVPNQSGSIYKV